MRRGAAATSASAVLALLLAAAGRRADGLPRGAQAQDAPAAIWVEGEDAARTTFNRHGWYSADGVRRDVLSPGEPGGRAGAWLAHYANDGQAATADYDVDVASSGRYRLWLRASVYQAGLAWRLDDGARRPIDTATAARERLNLVAPGIDIRFLAWLDAGEVELAAGRRRLALEVSGHPARNGGREVHGGLDALVLVPAALHWAPTSALRPPDPRRPPAPAAPDAWFPLVAPDDAFDPASVTDASALVTRPAGRHGPVRAVDEGIQFADGTPVRFWGVNALPLPTPEQMARQARFYAKHGINLVRLHPVQSIVGLLRRQPDGSRGFDPAGLDRLDRYVAALKAEGIYVGWSPFYPHVVTADDGVPPAIFAELPDAPTWNLPPGTSGKSTSGVVHFVPALQAAEWTWLAALLEHRNPYTGLRYVDEPALALLEVRNEDSLLWHAPLNDLEAGRMGPAITSAFQGAWQAWIRAHYPSDAALFAAWGPVGAGRRADDSRDNARPAIYGAWEMQADGPSRNASEARRMGDFIRFAAETMRDGYLARQAQLRALGYQGLTVSTAWQAGGPAAHLANLWSDAALDVVDRHAYWGGGAGGHEIRAGDVSTASHLRRLDEGIVARGYEQVEDRPFMLSEWTQSPPNEWKAEIAPLVAFYGFGLGGWDASTHFSAGRAGLAGGWPDENSYVTETPAYIGQFPALARAVHRGDLAAGPIVAARRLTTADAFTGRDVLTRGAPSGGWGRDGGPLTLAPGAQLMGRVTLAVGDDVTPSARADTQTLVRAGAIHSATGELAWHTDGVVVADSPRTQAVVGFAAHRTFALDGVELAVGATPFVSLIVTSLDGAPVRHSRRLLVTALARDRQTGARYSADGARLESVGGPPLLLEPVQARLRLRHGRLVAVHALRPDGVPRPDPLAHDGHSVVIDGRAQTYLYLLEAEPDGGAPATATATAEATVGATAGATATGPAVAGPTATPTATLPVDPTPAAGARRLWLPAVRRADAP